MVKKISKIFIENMIYENGKFEIMHEKNFPCTICGTDATAEAVLSKALLNGKMTSETTNRIISCPICGNAFILDLPYLSGCSINDIKEYVLKNPAEGDEYNCFADMRIYSC